jgi:predicted nucleic acid-binding protein
MILVDSSVWIDLLRNKPTPETDRLELFLREGQVAVGDLMLAEVLQGIRTDRHFEDALGMFAAFPVVTICNPDIAIEAARNYRRLRVKGVTPRKTIDTLIATRCIMDGHALLFSDRDFTPFVEHLGLVDAMGV